MATTGKPYTITVVDIESGSKDVPIEILAKPKPLDKNRTAWTQGLFLIGGVAKHSTTGYTLNELYDLKKALAMVSIEDMITACKSVKLPK